jgi:hypothetical protein
VTRRQRRNLEAIMKRIEVDGRLKPGQAFDVMNELCRVLASTVGPCVLSAMLEHGLGLHRQAKPRPQKERK